MNIIYRAPTQGDLNFILDSWLKSYRQSDFASFVPNKLYFEYHKLIVQDILKRSQILMISDPEDSNHVYGYVVFEQFNGYNILHYLYIKYTYRNLGFAKAALQVAFPDFLQTEIHLTHLDKSHLRQSKFDKQEDGSPAIYRQSFFMKKKDQYKLVYNPYMLVR